MNWESMSDDQKFAYYVKSHRKDGKTLQGLIVTYNWATDPSKLRTDQEHRICRLLARWAYRKLAYYRHGWNENENGKLHLER